MIFPQVPVRQWVLSLPKRLRYFVHRDGELAGRVLKLWLRGSVHDAADHSGAAAAELFGFIGIVIAARVDHEGTLPDVRYRYAWCEDGVLGLSLRVHVERR